MPSQTTAVATNRQDKVHVIKGQSLYLHFIQLPHVSSMTWGVNPWKPARNHFVSGKITILWRKIRVFFFKFVSCIHFTKCAANCYLSQIQKIWYFDINVKQEKQMPEWMFCSQVSKDPKLMPNLYLWKSINTIYNAIWICTLDTKSSSKTLYAALLNSSC